MKMKVLTIVRDGEKETKVWVIMTDTMFGFVTEDEIREVLNKLMLVIPGGPGCHPRSPEEVIYGIREEEYPNEKCAEIAREIADIAREMLKIP